MPIQKVISSLSFEEGLYKFKNGIDFMPGTFFDTILDQAFQAGCALKKHQLHVPVKIWTKDVDENAIAQLKNIAHMPFIFKHVAAMADVHLGKGATVGSVISTKGAIIPAAVGVDLSCGMIAVRLNLRAEELPDNLHEIRTEIERLIPHGRTNDGGSGDWGAWHDIPADVSQAWYTSFLGDGLVQIGDKHPDILKRKVNAINHLGTLGTGNHFIEVCLDENNDVWIMLHSGSRGIGNRIGTYFIDLAKKDMKRWMINLPDQDLAYIPEGSEYFNDYINALKWASKFAFASRTIMLNRAIQALRNKLPYFNTKESYVMEEAINCHHNYVNQEHHYGENVYVTRKGAIRAREGDMGIIPASMGQPSYIVRGKGNPESFCSASHGAGRKMSRTAAKKQFTVADLEVQTFGVECRKDSDIIDEIPGAYKDMNVCMENQTDLVDIVHKLKAVICVKG